MATPPAGQPRGRWARALVGDPEPVGDGAWAMRGGLPRHGINVFFIKDGDQVVCFDSGAREMGGEISRLAEPFGGISRVVLSHCHFDHRGGTRGIDAPVYCHPAERGDVEGRDAGMRYWGSLAGESRVRVVRARLMKMLRDSGPVTVDGTVDEGDRIGSFVVLHVPGHAPGQIALWREEDRTIIASDCFYVLDGQAALSHRLFSHDPDEAVRSLQRIADLEPRVAWPAHGPALTGDVRAILERAIATEGEGH
jgi:glyoxylase-like metal-dependent hydrolase (beta-lactamase superfamily II)